MRDARLAAWETYETLPVPQRTDEEWRRTDLRGLKLDRLRHSPEREIGRVARRRARRSPDAGRHLATRAPGPASIVQRDASTIFTELNDDLRAQGVIFTDLDTAMREHAELVKQYFMTAGRAGRRSASSKHCMLRSGRAARSSTCRRASVSSCRSARSRSRRCRRFVDLHAHARRAGRGRRGVCRRCVPVPRRRTTVIRVRAWSS